MSEITSRNVGEDVAMEVLHHIRTMYPAMFEAVPKAAQTSVRNCIVNQCVRYIRSHGLVDAPRNLSK